MNAEDREALDDTDGGAGSGGGLRHELRKVLTTTSVNPSPVPYWGDAERHPNLAKLFEGAAVTGAVLAFAIIIYYALSASLLMCSCVSLAHPTKKFNRGVCCGGALWLMFMTLNSALQFTSYSGLVSSLGRYDTGFNQSLLMSCYSFGYISAICFLLLSIAFFFWKEKIVTVHH